MALPAHRWPLAQAVLFGLGISAAWWAYGGSAASRGEGTTGFVNGPWGEGGRGRALLGGGGCGTDCNHAAWEGEWYGIVGYLFGIIYLFLGLAIVCDDFFVGSLEVISDKLQLSEDVAGATFMAAGSSAPELFSSLMSLLSTQTCNEMGIGTIVGSAVFNVLMIIGITAMMAGGEVLLDWRPIVRDAGFYSLAIISVMAIVSDGVVYWWEGLIATCCYGLYILFMTRNAQLLEKLGDMFKKSAAVEPESPGKELEKGAQKGFLTDSPKEGKDSENPGSGDMVEIKLKEGKRRRRSVSFDIKESTSVQVTKEELQEAQRKHGDEAASVLFKQKSRRASTTPSLSVGRVRAMAIDSGMSAFSRTESKVEAVIMSGAIGVDPVMDLDPESIGKGLEAHIAASTDRPSLARSESNGTHPGPADDSRSDISAATGTSMASEGDDDEGSPFVMPRNLADLPYWLVALPWNLSMTLTIPKCETERMENFYILTFLMSLAWITGITYFMVEWSARLGCILEIPHVVMGQVVLAAGSSVPDALSSVAVAKQGMGDMAIANAIGSNIFDIWLGLGVPWSIVLPFREGGKQIVSTDQLLTNVGIMFGVLILYWTTIVGMGWKLTNKTGVIFIFVYLLYVVYNIVVVWQLEKV
mgnify:CR=1 FL=1